MLWRLPRGGSGSGGFDFGQLWQAFRIPELGKMNTGAREDEQEVFRLLCNFPFLQGPVCKTVAVLFI